MHPCKAPSLKHRYSEMFSLLPGSTHLLVHLMPSVSLQCSKDNVKTVILMELELIVIRVQNFMNSDPKTC